MTEIEFVEHKFHEAASLLEAIKELLDPDLSDELDTAALHLNETWDKFRERVEEDPEGIESNIGENLLLGAKTY